MKTKTVKINKWTMDMGGKNIEVWANTNRGVYHITLEGSPNYKQKKWYQFWK